LRSRPPLLYEEGIGTGLSISSFEQHAQTAFFI
jgi:hypothetical protein